MCGKQYLVYGRLLVRGRVVSCLARFRGFGYAHTHVCLSVCLSASKHML